MSFNYYENTNFINNRNRKRTLILDVSDENAETHLGDGGEFNIKLFEPLRIDKHSEIYLDNFLSFNSNIAQTIQTSAFLLKINEFNMNSNVASSSNNNHIFNSLLIPNEHKSAGNNHSGIIHKGKKFNYVCDINPQTISSLSGRITDLAGSPIFHGSLPNHNFTYALTGITSGKIQTLVESPSIFTGISIGGTNILIVGLFLATHLTTATTLHFSLTTELNPTQTALFVDGGGDITFSSTPDIQITNGTVGDNPNIHLVNEPGRFIAEFSIISRE